MANKLKPYCEQVHCRNFHVWKSHRQHAIGLRIRLFQTTPYDRLFISKMTKLLA